MRSLSLLSVGAVGGIGRLALLKLLVQLVKNNLKDVATDNGDTEHGGNDAVALAEPVLLKVPDVRSGDVAKLGEGVDHGDGNGTLGGGTRERGRDPGVEDDEAGVGASLEKESDVARGDVEGRHGDDETNQTNADGADNVPEALLGAIGVPGVDQRDDAGEGPGRRAHEQGRDVAEAQGLGEGREEGVEGKTDDVGGEGQHHDVDLDVLDSHDETVERAHVVRVGVSLTDILSHAQLSDVELLLGEATRVSGQVGKDEGGGDGDTHSDGTLDPEEPAPGSVSEDALHVGEDTGADEGGEGVGDEVTAEEDGVAGGELAAGVPL